MVTLIVTATTAWAEVIATAETAWILQNIGTNPIYVRYDGGTPEVAEQGMKLSSGEMIQTGTTDGPGDVWIRTMNATSAVAVTK